MAQTEPQFAWVPFYEEFADKLLEYKGRREDLTRLFREGIEASPISFPITDRFPTEGPLADICPFTVMTSINILGSNDEHRVALCNWFKSRMGISAAAPGTTLAGSPMYPQINLRWFRFTAQRGEENRKSDIDKLWRAFEIGIRFADPNESTTERNFVQAFDEAAKVPGVGHRLPSGLYWSRPNFFPTLDAHSKIYLRQILRISVPKSKKVLGEQYLSIRNDLRERLDSGEAPFSSFQHLSHRAWQYQRENAKLTSVEQELAAEGAYDPSNESDARYKVLASIARRRGQPKFRDKLLDAYDERCAITGYNEVEALEAAHIRLYKGSDMNEVHNGLLLRADIHTLFDRHLIGLDPISRKVWIGEQLSRTQYAELEGREARPPKRRKDRPDPDALREHREEAKRLGKIS